MKHILLFLFISPLPFAQALPCESFLTPDQIAARQILTRAETARRKWKSEHRQFNVPVGSLFTLLDVLIDGEVNKNQLFQILAERAGIGVDSVKSFVTAGHRMNFMETINRGQGNQVRILPAGLAAYFELLGVPDELKDGAHEGTRTPKPCGNGF